MGLVDQISDLISFIINLIVSYSTAFAVGFVESMAECKKKKGMTNAFAYATKIASTASIITNVFYFMPPFTFFLIALGQIPYLGYFTNGLVLNLGFKLAGMFMKC